jgi:hypothetical protein
MECRPSFALEGRFLDMSPIEGVEGMAGMAGIEGNFMMPCLCTVQDETNDCVLLSMLLAMMQRSLSEVLSSLA